MILKCEIKKIITFPALWGFILLLTAFNVFLAVNFNYGMQIDYINSVNRIAGTRYGADYLERVNAIIPPEEREYGHSDLWLYDNIVDGAEQYTAARTAKYYAEEFKSYSELEEIKKMPLSEKIISLMGAKYEKIKTVAAFKNASGESSAVVFGSDTQWIFGNATTLTTAMLCESIITAMLIILFSLSFDSVNGCDLLIYSSKIGRKKAVLYKSAAALAVSSIAFFIIFAVGYGVFFGINDFSAVWGEPISAYYSMISFGEHTMPVTAWNSLTFGGFFALSIILGYILMLIFVLFCTSLGLIMKNSFASFGIAALLSIANVAISAFPVPSELIKLISHALPAGIAYSQPIWFQYGGTATLLPYQETIFTLSWLAIASLAAALALKYFRRKDIA